MRGARRGLQRLGAGLMAGVCLGAVTAHATDGTWPAAPADGNWNNDANWTSSPTVPDGTATFVQSTQTAITFSTAVINVQTIQFTQASPLIPSTPLGSPSTSAEPASPIRRLLPLTTQRLLKMAPAP